MAHLKVTPTLKSTGVLVTYDENNKCAINNSAAHCSIHVTFINSPVF